MKKKLRCPECNHKMKFIKPDPDNIFPDGYYCKHCPNMYKPITVYARKEK